MSCNKKFNIGAKKPLAYPPELPSKMIIGLGQTDLTPPPGYPMSGYSVNGRISHGYWIHPKATALYLRDEAGTPFVFVTTDLWAITDGQKLRVLELLQDKKETNFIGESELLLSATHSHHSLGVNVPDKAYTLSSIGFGFDSVAFEFTARRIAMAIVAAVQSAEPGTISFAMDSVYGVAKNRSVNAYLRNNPMERNERFYFKKVAKHKADITKGEFESMIDPWLTLITVRKPSGEIRGILASFPVHPTATGDATEVYSADIFGLASGYASTELMDHPIIAFFNGAEGDVAPDYLFHTRADALRIAKELSKAIVKTANAHTEIQFTGKIEHRSNTMTIAASKAEYDRIDTDCYCFLPEPEVSTSKKAVIGASVFGGASDGRTSLSGFGFNDGIRSSKWDPEQGYKMPAGKYLVKNVLGPVIHQPIKTLIGDPLKTKPTKQLRISIHKVGDFFFTGLPGEFTTMLGRRLRKTISTQFKSVAKKVLIVGLADAYNSYVTTPCEYNEQAYEGASNYFGFASGQVFAKAYEKLSHKAPDNMSDRVGREMTYNVGGFVEFGPSHLGELQVWNAEEGLANLLVSENGTKLHSRFILPEVLAKGVVVEIEPDEVATYSFDDVVTEIEIDKKIKSNNQNFYPTLTVQTEQGDILTIPEYILTVDQYSKKRSTWTVRIPDLSFLKGATGQIIITPVSDQVPYMSAFFRKK